MKKRLLALLLAIAMVLCLFGCTQEPIPTEPPTEPPTQAPTEPPLDGAQIYADAAAALSAGDVTLDVVSTKTTTVEDQSFVTEAIQVVTYEGVGTDAPKMYLQETMPFWEYDDELNLECTDLQYTEAYAAGTLYIELEDKARLSASMDAEGMANRYVPAVLLDSALYGDIGAEETGDVITLTFAAPTAAEIWAVPAEAELVEATGTATVTAGSLTAMTYTVTYDYGTVTVTQTTESKPRAQAESVILPPEAAQYMYTQIQTPDALKMYLQAVNLQDQLQSATVSELGSMFSQAAGILFNESNTLNFNRQEELVSKLEMGIFYMNYPTDDEVHIEQTETYKDGKYVTERDGGVPTTDTEITEEDVWNNCQLYLENYIPEVKYWQDVTMEDLGTLYYMEYTYHEDYGDYMQNNVCTSLFGNPTILNNMASAYVTDEIGGYLSIDKYTGLIVANGYKYQGTHTIDGDPYTLTDQLDQSFVLPSFGAYKAVTEELLPEAEPENKATPLFYHVTGDNGQEMWLLGTIHVGDERTGYLPQEIYDAFAASDALALECDTEAFDKLLEEDEELQDEASGYYYYDDGSTVAEHVDEELYTTALKYMKATGNYNMNADYMKVSTWASSIENFYLDQGHTLSREQGVEERLTKLAHDQEKEIPEVESNMFQIKMLNSWSEELQELLLEESVEYAGIDSIIGTNELFDMWCAGDEAALREYLAEEVDTSEMTEEELAEYEAAKPLIEEYNKAMSYDRNDGMLEVAIEYLESGDVVFYAVGLAHLLDSHNGLVDTLRAAGYTVELVTYGQ